MISYVTEIMYMHALADVGFVEAWDFNCSVPRKIMDIEACFPEERVEFEKSLSDLYSVDPTTILIPSHLQHPKETGPNSITEETVLCIELADEKWMSNPWAIKRRYLTTQQFLTHFDQYRYIYEQILTEIAAIEFRHTRHDPNKVASTIQYSKATIKNIMPIVT